MESISRIEQPVTPEKSREELYFDTLKAKRDVLSSHYTLNQLRKGRKVDEMSDAEIEDYKSVKNEYDKRKELFLASFDNLNEDDSQNISELTSLIKVEIALSSLEKPAEAGVGGAIAGESVGQPAIEIPARDMTLEEIDQKISFAKNQTLGLSGESAEYWETQKALLFERQEAEANPDRPAPSGFGQRVKTALNNVAKTIIEVDPKMWPIFGVPDWAKKKSAEPVESKTESTSEKTETQPKKPSGWGWLKERGKGIWNFGIWEFHQAERFRSKTKEAANDTEALATLIQQERNLSPEEAEKEAWETVEELKKNDLDISAPEFYQANRDITERKRKENDEEVEYIIRSASNDLLDKLAKYRGEAGQDVLTQENKLAFQADLRGELNKMRDGAVRKDFVNFAKLMRRNLDENWQWRYVWGAAEAALGFVGVKFLVLKWEAIQAAKLAAAEKAAAGGAKGGAEKFLTEKMHKNVWTTLKEMAQRGPKHLNLDDQTLTDLSQKVLNNNGMYEPEWVKGVVEGLKSSRVLPEGLPIKIPLEVLRVLGY